MAFLGVLILLGSQGTEEQDKSVQKEAEAEKEKKTVKEKGALSGQEPGKEDFSGQDFEKLVGRTDAALKKIGLAEENSSGKYSGLDGNIRISCDNGYVSTIQIKGDRSTAPSFHKVKIGMGRKKAEGRLSDAYPEPADSPGGFKLLNLDTGGSVECEVTGGKVSAIRFQTLSGTEIARLKAAKEEKQRAEYIFPDSDKTHLSEEDVRGRDDSQFLIGRNEIFARHGYIFEMEELKAHFEGTSWYKGTVPGSKFNMEAELNDFAKKNVELIKKVEDETNAAAQQEAEKQAAVDQAYNFVSGRTFGSTDRQLAIEFDPSGEFVAIGYYGSSPLTNKYCTYIFSAEYEYSHDVWQYLTYVQVEGVRYQFRYFDDGRICLAGPGEFDGWYKLR